MDTKKVLERLLKIAENQQKIIMKLAQTQGLPPDSLPNSQVSFESGKAPTTNVDTPPAHLDPNKTVREPNKLFWSAMGPQQQALLAGLPTVVGNEMRITFKPGKATQANYDVLFKVLQGLSNRIGAFSLKSV